jgi:hypothetical protein
MRIHGTWSGRLILATIVILSSAIPEVGQIIDRDRFPGYTFEQMRPHLDAFADELKRKSTLRGYIIFYGGRQGCVNEVKNRMKRTRDYLSKKYGIKGTSLLLVNGGFREELEMELYLSERGRPVPKAAPTLNRSEVIFLDNGQCKGINARRLTRRR